MDKQVNMESRSAEQDHIAKQKTDIASVSAKYDSLNRKYVVFICAFMHHFFIGGYNAMISIMFVDIVRDFQANRSEASLMQSLSRGFMFGGGAVGEILIRKLGFTRCVFTGCVLVSACLMAAAFASDITTVVILLGVGAGSGLMMPLLSTYIGVGRAFDHLSFPKFMAYTVAGGGVGAIVLPYMAETTLDKYGWRGMCIFMSGFFLNLIVFTIGMHFNLPKHKDLTPAKIKNDACNLRILTKPMFITYITIIIPYGLTGFVESWYVPDFMVSIGYTREQGSILLTVIGASSAFGRLLAGFVHPICIYTNTHIIYHWVYLFLLLAASHVLFPLFPVYATLFAACVIYGVLFGIIFSQCSPIIREAVGPEGFPLAQGVHSTVYGLFSSIGGVVAGSVKDITGSYEMVFYLAAWLSLFCSLCVILFIFFESVGRKLCKPDNRESTNI